MALKTLPNNLEAEQSVLGSCFLSKYALERACEQLTEESFYSDKNAKIFASLQALLDAKTPVDITTVTTDLKNKKLLYTQKIVKIKSALVRLYLEIKAIII